MDEGGWLRAPPCQSGGASDRSSAVTAQALSLAVRVPAGWKQHHRLCHAGPASGAERRRAVRCVGAFWSGWLEGFGSARRSTRAQLPGSAPAMCRATFSSRPMPDRCPLWGRLPGIGRWPVVGVSLALSSRWPPVGLPAGWPAYSLFSRSWHLLSVVEAHQVASEGRTVPGSLALLRVAAAGRGAWAWSAPGGNGVRATGVGRHAAGGGAPVRLRLPRGPSDLTPRSPCGCGPSPGAATGGPWQSAWAPRGRHRLTSPRAVAGRSPRPSPAGGAHASHADSPTAPRSPR
jgi:hypothetical protein